MRVYLAGSRSAGNINALLKGMARIYLAGVKSRPYVLEHALKEYLPQENELREQAIKDGIFLEKMPYLLESYYYIRNSAEWYTGIKPFVKDFLLDSGAFTFLTANAKGVNWNNYVEQYAEFVKTNDINQYIELDIDNVVGLPMVEKYRSRLEQVTGKPCIPVWHRKRGLDYWRGMVKDYDYVSIGGIVTKEIKKEEYDIFIPLLDIARENNCKVHGLGFTRLNDLKRYRFYSVDSTSWLYGNIGGGLFIFTGNDIKKIKPLNMKLKNRAGAIHNFIQWVKYSHYADGNL
jgi:hypothetical protein